MSPRPRVQLFAEPNALSLSLVEKLLGNFCSISVSTNEVEEWEKKTSHISQRQFLKIGSVPEEEYDYGLLVDPGLTLPKETYDRFLSSYKRTLSKSLVIIPFMVDGDQKSRADEIIERTKEESGNLGAILVGDLVGARVESETSALADFITEALKKKTITLSEERGEFFPVSAPFTAKEVARSLFSFGPYGDSLAILGPKVSDIEMGQRLQGLIGPVEIKYQQKNRVAVLEKAKIQQEQISLNLLLKETLEWVEDHPERQPRVARKEVKEEKKVETRPRKDANFRGPLLLVLALFFLPYFLFALSLGLLFASSKTLYSFNLPLSNLLFSAARGTSYLSFVQLSLYSRVPLTGELFVSSAQASNLVYKISDAGLKGISTGKKLSNLLSKVLGEEVYDISSLSRDIALDLDSLYKETSFIESEIENLIGVTSGIAEIILGPKGFSEIREQGLEVKRIVEELPFLLGSETPQKYLVLLQNNMELRPTGGFIGSFAVVTFDSGRMSDVSVMDVYAADGQLKGHVEPPLPIKEHLGEANWYLRDSNWDPDFPVSAARAEWFLDKEISVKVDGVIALDLEFVKKILESTGPLPISDFNEVVNHQNLYEITQRRVEEDFFPGSYQKASFLTALTRELVSTLSEPKENRLTVARVTLESLRGRHIQVFFHNPRVQNSFSKLGFDGAVKEPVCSGNCFADWWALVDANLGVNKANYFVKKSMGFQVFVSEGSLKRFLTVSYENTASPALGSGGRYKSYLRLLIPQEAIVNNVAIAFANEKEEVVADTSEVRGRKEAGVLVEILPGQKKDVIFSWEEDNPLLLSSEGEYRLYVRKQAGSVNDGLSVAINIPKSPSLLFEPAFFLTSQGDYVYNTTLTRDFFSRISWKNGQTSFRSRD